MNDTARAGAENRRLKRQLRATLRSRRRGIAPQQRVAANRRICAHISAIPAWRRARNVATFLAFDGEPSLDALQRDSRCASKRFHVPVIRSQRMLFAPLESSRGMRSNSFGIREPRHRVRVPRRQLDIVLVSLVGFDPNGNRLGMGGGFYDRHFSFLTSRIRYFRPRLIGVAYAFQEVAQVPHDPWDVPMWGIVTEQGFRRI